MIGTMPDTTRIVSPTAPHTHTVIFLHGRGSDAKTFQDEIFESQDSKDAFFTQLFPDIKWIFPEAKKRWAVVEEEEIHQWFDIASVKDPWKNAESQREGLAESAEQIRRIIEQEATVIDMGKIILAGISQGCATAIYTLLKGRMNLGGFFGLCSWLPMAEELEREAQMLADAPSALETLVLLQHCENDEVVPIKNGRELAASLERMGMKVQWQSHKEGGHWLNEPDGMDQIVAFIRAIAEG
ncbi:alpha/beta-hydrolase [Setomelanomma holmii]|uniref:Alpha/beta-hydrolase n=1 Tax=Setomelanomma holmii TaxID=210430 RepID=A0A9P4LL93_9PLEO|nr:alpha/beta-hydrolase [Setomelanomma holmii]